jgi:hypothetical protein
MVLLVLWVTDLARSGEVRVRIGDDTFRPGRAEVLAEVIAEKGPLLVADVAGGDRDLILQHLGPGPEQGWHAFAARPLDAPRDCFAQWDAGARHFVDSCDGTVYPADGAGLPSFPVRINDGELEVVVVASNDPAAASDAGDG